MANYGPRPERLPVELIAEVVDILTDELGYPPTVREVARRIKRTPSVTMRYLEEARDAGVLTWERGLTRTLRAA